jgi:plasmid maintenance system antidote protein VapI
VATAKQHSIRIAEARALLGASLEFWINLQAMHDFAKAKQEKRPGDRTRGPTASSVGRASTSKFR